jgi:hypothetical protein
MHAYIADILFCHTGIVIPSGKKFAQWERLRRQTEAILRESRREVQNINVSEEEARHNIRSFLEHLPEFNRDLRKAA